MRSPDIDFFNPYRHGFARVAVAVPRIRVADPAFNAGETIADARAGRGAGRRRGRLPRARVCRPTPATTCSTSAPCSTPAKLRSAASPRRPPPSARSPSSACRCASTIDSSTARRWSATAASSASCRRPTCRTTASSTRRASSRPATPRCRRAVRLLDADVPFGADLIFETPELPLLKIACEICEDVWVPIPPSSYAALAGATVLVNLSASNITIGKSDYRHRLVSVQSSRCLAAYLYSSAGLGESTTDLGWDGQALIYESGELLAESERFVTGSHFISADVDLERVSRERMRQNSFGYSVEKHEQRVCAFRRVPFTSRLADAVPARAAAQGRPLSLRPGRPGDARRALHGGLQHPGQRAAAAAERGRRQEARHRHLGRARLDSRPPRLRGGDGPRRAAAQQTSSPTRCPASRRPRARSTRPSA